MVLMASNAKDKESKEVKKETAVRLRPERAQADPAFKATSRRTLTSKIRKIKSFAGELLTQVE